MKKKFMIICSETKQKLQRGVINEKDDEENLGMSISVHNDRDDVTRFDGERKAATSYELRIGDTEVTDENLSGAGWSYDPSTKTLTLDGLNCQKSKVGEGVIHSYRDLNLVLKNKNKIENLASALSGNWQSGIRVNGKLTISGSGSLITTGEQVTRVMEFL